MLGKLSEEMWLRLAIADLLCSGKKLSRKQRKKAAEFILGVPIERRGRKSGTSADAIRNAELFIELRPDCKSDTECYRKIIVKIGLAIEEDAMRKSVEAGQRALMKQYPQLPARSNLSDVLRSYMTLALNRLENPENNKPTV